MGDIGLRPELLPFGEFIAWVCANSKHLRSIDLPERDLEDDEVQDLVNCLIETKKSSIATIILGGNNIGAAGSEALACLVECHSLLTRLDLRRNRIGAAGAEALSNALAGCRLRRLNLARNGLKSAGAKAIATAIRANCTLRHLCIEHNDVGDEGAAALGTALGSNEYLLKLELGHNSIGPAGVCAISEGLKANRSLNVLGLSGNLISDDGAVALADAMKWNNALNWIGLEPRGITLVGVDSFCRAIYDDSDPRRVFESNHTLSNVYGMPKDVTNQELFRSLLRLNKAGPSAARRQKISRYLHEQPKIIARVDVKLIPRILARAMRESICELGDMHKHILEIPDVVNGSDGSAGCSSSTTTKPRANRSAWRKSCKRQTRVIKDHHRKKTGALDSTNIDIEASLLKPSKGKLNHAKAKNRK